ncbi:MAG: lysophospholipid acyltransferase family protein [Aggregatilineales bacterium]
MTLSAEVQAYVARQPHFTWRRRFLRWLIRLVLFRLLLKVTVTGVENLPSTGPAILVTNHTSLLDPVLAIGAVTNRFVIPMTKVENLKNPLLAPFIYLWGAYSVKRGEVDRKALANSIELVKNGQFILIAPEGTRQRALSRPKDGLAYVATKADAWIVPMGISGAENWQRELLRLRRPRVRIHLGRPFRLKMAGEKRVPRETLSAMMEEVMYQLALAIPDPALRGVYQNVEQATANHLEFLA